MFGKSPWSKKKKKEKCEKKEPQGPRESEDVSKCSSLAVNVHE